MPSNESPVDQLLPKTLEKNHRAYLWVYRNGYAMCGQQGGTASSSWVMSDYQTSRSSEYPCIPSSESGIFLSKNNGDKYMGLFL